MDDDKIDAYAFLKSITANKTPVTIFLVNGVKLQGTITNFNYASQLLSCILKRDVIHQLLMGTAISTIMPSEPIGDSDEIVA